MASILNRTLVVPPILDHHAVALGSCPKFRVLSPPDLRFAVWNHSIELLRDCRYVSMADIIDLSGIVSASAVSVVDFRVFVSEWCGVNLDHFCTRNQNAQSLMLLRLNECGSLLSGKNGNLNSCLYALEEDCRTTVWTYQKDGEDGALDSFQPDEELKKKKRIAFVRRRRDVYKTLGPGSAVESAKVIAFGSLFTSPYKGSESHIDIHEAPNDKRIASFIKRIEFLPFVPEILDAGKNFVLKTIKAPFLCAQLRLLDGQFKNHWKATFQELKHKLESLKQTGPNPVHMFLMTDLPMSNWSGSYLGDITKDSGIKLFVLKEDDELVRETARNVVKAGNGMKVGSDSKYSIKIRENQHAQALPDVLLYIEETVCSCASLGFVGTSGSTIAESIELMRKFNICNS
nr:O-fucosyltransferase 30 [Ipomoea batatas]